MSTNYYEITEKQALETPLAEAWKDSSIPPQQYTLSEGEYQRWVAGTPVAPFDALRDCLKPIGDGKTVLEVGCGAGYYYNVLQHCGDYQYFGVDYSEEAIRIAKTRNESAFAVMDALLLDIDDRRYEIVISGSVLLHIVDWRRALKEAARVCSRYLILHRTPVQSQPTQYYFKNAYGVQCVEIHFNKAELLDECELNGFSLVRSLFVTVGQETLLLERALMHHPV